MTAISLLLPSNIRISRAIDIQATPQNVKAQITEMEEWGLWNEYIKALPDIRVENDSIHSSKLSVFISGSGAGFVNTEWRPQKGKPFSGVYNIIGQGSVTTLQWYFAFRLKWYPWEKFGSIIYDKQLGPQMEQSLINLKELLEKAP